MDPPIGARREPLERREPNPGRNPDCRKPAIQTHIDCYVHPDCRFSAIRQFESTVVVLSSPAEWEKVRAGRLSLPSGWGAAAELPKIA
jgi:hypothetical protein